ncbi:hypothetical protein F5Y11DRAFT_345706 [Daldinia sp. FL1419]|nr:hypothetical protein F5Y11DRAFT_345706 [Daldinia sp. FL1419]
MRRRLFGSPYGHRPNLETPIGRALAHYGQMWNMHPTELLPRARQDGPPVARPTGAWVPLGGPLRTAGNWVGRLVGWFATAEESGTAENNIGERPSVTRKLEDLPELRHRDDLYTHNPAYHDDAPPNGIKITLTSGWVAYFHQIRKFLLHRLDENDLPVYIDLTCPICNDRGLRFDVPPPGALCVSGYFRETEDMEVLPCGHMVGLWCMLERRKQCEEENRKHTCPVCQFSLHHADPRCNHLVRTYLISGQDALPPLTIPEGGRPLNTCSTCRGSDPAELPARLAWDLSSPSRLVIRDEE